MIVINDISGLRTQVQQWRQAGQRIAFVPTMGNLHAGHLSLVSRAAAAADKVLVSIFVNPLQFGEGEDYDDYPRTLQADLQQLAKTNADLVYTPDVLSLYGNQPQAQTRVIVPGLSDILCGQYRPGHFDGVTTVVAKLFNLVQPDIAVFGKKDYQQLMIIRRMVDELNFPVKVLGGDIVRDSDGLAMSSRNQYLSDAQRAVAAELYKGLCQLADHIRQPSPYQPGLQQVATRLTALGFSLDYLDVRRQQDLALRPGTEPWQGDEALIILVAAHLGATRLLDNLEIHQTSGL